MRFALLEIKLTLIKLLQRYYILAGPKTAKKLVLKDSLAIRAPVENIFRSFQTPREPLVKCLEAFLSILTF